MSYYAGIDVSLEQSSVCVLDGEGKIIREAKVASEPEALIAWFGSLGLAMTRIGLEAGPLSQWLFAAMKQAGLPVELLETRHVRNAFKTMPVKTDRKDARGIAELMRMGWFRPVHCKSISAQETRAILTTRTLIEAKLRDVEMSLRGVLRGFGLKVGKTTPTQFCRTDQGAGQRAFEFASHRRCAVGCTRSAVARVQEFREARSDDGATRRAGQAADDHDRRRGGHLTDICGRNR